MYIYVHNYVCVHIHMYSYVLWLLAHYFCMEHAAANNLFQFLFERKHTEHIDIDTNFHLNYNSLKAFTHSFSQLFDRSFACSLDRSFKHSINSFFFCAFQLLIILIEFSFFV